MDSCPQCVKSVQIRSLRSKFPYSVRIQENMDQKNSVFGHFSRSAYQLAIGKNPKLPSTLNEKAPALTRQFVSKIVSSNLDATHREKKPSLPTKTPR